MATTEFTHRETKGEPDFEPVSFPVSDQPKGSTVARLNLLWENRSLLGRAAGVSLIVWVIVAFLIPPLYTSTTRLMPPDQSGLGATKMLAALSHAGDLGTSVGGDLLGLKTTGDLFVGDVADRAVILFDDLISSGTTLCRAAAKCREAGASRVFAAATHGLFIGNAPAVLGAAGFDGVVVGDTVRSEAENAGLLPENVTILDTSRLACEAIALAHSGL